MRKYLENLNKKGKKENKMKMEKETLNDIQSGP